MAIEVINGPRRNEPPWMIMEWIPDDLSSVTLAQADKVTALLHTMEGLTFMHAKGFTHRDLKPDNILLVLEDGRLKEAKIADFGTTKHDRSGKMQTFAGTSIYMAPELWLSDLNYTNTVDVWSFGVLAAELLTTRAWALEWRTRQPASKDLHKQWIRESLRPCVAAAPETFRPLLSGTLLEAPEDRWSTAQCRKWLREHVDVDNVRQNTPAQSGDLGISTCGPDEIPSPGSTIADPEIWNTYLRNRNNNISSEDGTQQM